MRKDCHTCKHELFDKCCNDCLYGDPPSNWEAASYYVPDTNAEKIRSMSDEQLAEFLCKISDCAFDLCPAVEMCGCGDGIANGLLKWLKQPAE
jgi:hypothetical protein